MAFLKDYGGMILSGAALPAIGLLIYWLRTRVDLEARKETVEADTKVQPIEVLKQQLASREQEANSMRERFYGFFSNKLEEDKSLIKVLAEHAATLREISTDLKSHREEESRRSGEIRAELNDIKVQVAGIGRNGA